jgi:hypothetical protein
MPNPEADGELQKANMIAWSGDDLLDVVSILGTDANDTGKVTGVTSLTYQPEEFTVCPSDTEVLTTFQQICVPSA